MSLLDGSLGAVFAATFGALFRDATLHKAQDGGGGTGGFVVTTTDYPIKLSVDALGAKDQAMSGLPRSAVRLIILASGLPVSVDLDDGVSVGGSAYRVIAVASDPAHAAIVATAVPA